MFLEAYNVTKHRVLMGESVNSLKTIAIIKDLNTNIITPEKLMPETTYYWRVDSYVPTAAQEWKTGKLWHFTTTSHENTI